MNDILSLIYLVAIIWLLLDISYKLEKIIKLLAEK